MIFQSRKWLTLFLVGLITGCTYNPFREDNELTGHAGPTLVGAGIGAGGAAIAQASPVEIAAAGVAGGLVGYYISTLRFASGGVSHVGGQVYTLGNRATIVIPTDMLFDTNSADFLPEAPDILDSVVDVLARYPHNNILVSGNTSGFYSRKYEQQLSEARARQVASYLWAHGINNFEPQSNNMRCLTYVGYGNLFPVANNINTDSVRENSRIQITSYPSKKALGYGKKYDAFHNVGASNDTPSAQQEPELSDNTNGQRLAEDNTSKDSLDQNNKNYNTVIGSRDNTDRRPDLKGEMWDSYNKVNG